MNAPVKSVLKGIILVLVISAGFSFLFRNLLPRVDFFAESFFIASIINSYTPVIGAFGFSLLISGIAGVSGISLRVFFSLMREGQAELDDICGLVMVGIVVGFGFLISSWYVISFARLMR